MNDLEDKAVANGWHNPEADVPEFLKRKQEQQVDAVEVDASSAEAPSEDAPTL